MNDNVLEDMSVRPDILGIDVLHGAFAETCSTQRISMFSAHQSQSLNLHGAEFPGIATGWECMSGNYEWASKLEHDIQIIKVIPKFRLNMGASILRHNPSKLIIYRTINTEHPVVDIMEIKDYTALTDGFGYKNKMTEANYLLSENSIITKGTQFTTSPSHDDELYKQGVNANVVYLTEQAVTEDAARISESLAKKMEHTAICSSTIQIPRLSIPLNNYGTDDEYKLFPDVGDIVNKDGVLMAFRPKHDETFLSEIKNESLMKTEYLHDNIYYAVPGAEILDVQVYITHRAFRNKKYHNGPYSQLFKYQAQHNQFYEDVLNTHQQLKTEGEAISNKFSNYIIKLLELNPNYNEKNEAKNKKLINKKDLINFAQVAITYGYKRNVGLGFKITGRYGDKGVISAITPDDEMPVDSAGVKADLVCCPITVPSRLNTGQLYEQFFNRASLNVTTNVRTGVANSKLSKLDAFKYVLEYINDIRPIYAQHIESIISTKELQVHYIDDIIENGIYLVIPPFCKEITEDKVLFISEKYNVKALPTKYVITHSNGQQEDIHLKEPTIIGGKYLYLLCKIPEYQLSSVESSYLSHLGLPIKPKSKNIKAQLQLSVTSQRLGEDEGSMLNQSVGAMTLARYQGLYSGSNKANDMLQMGLLTAKYPTRIKSVQMTTEEIVESNLNVNMYKHLMILLGHKHEYIKHGEFDGK